MAKKLAGKSTKKAASRIELEQILADRHGEDALRLRRVLLDHLGEARPAWLWNACNGDLVWQNVAAQMYGDKRTGKKKKHGLDAMKGQLRRILNITPLGQETLSRLHFSSGKKTFDRICRCTPIRLAPTAGGEDIIGILSVSAEPVSEFDKAEPANLFATAHTLGFAAAMVRKGAVVIDQSDIFTALIDTAFDSELIVGLSSAARHGIPIAVESKTGRREFHIVRIAGKDKKYLALIDLHEETEAERTEIEPTAPVETLENLPEAVMPIIAHPSEEAQDEDIQDENLQDEGQQEEGQQDESFASPAPSNRGPLSLLIDQLSELTPIETEDDPVEEKPTVPVETTEEVEGLALVEPDAPEDVRELQQSDQEDEKVVTDEELAEQERYNFNEVSRILNTRLTGDGGNRGRHLRAVAGSMHPHPEITDVASNSSAEATVSDISGEGEDHAIRLNQDHLILNRLPLGVLIYRDQDILFANRAMIKLLGYANSEELHARGIAAVIPESGSDADFGPLAQLVNRSGDKFSVTTRLQTANWLGQPCFMITAQVAAAPILNESSSDESSVESQMFFDDVSRELRAPLNTISGFGEMLKMQEFGPLGHRRYVEYAGDIVTAANQANVILDEAGELRRLGADNPKVERKDIDLIALLEQAIGQVRPHANSGQVVIRKNIAEHVPGVSGDGSSIAKIVLNLLANAIYTAPNGGQVILTADSTPDQNYVEIHIRHSGGYDVQSRFRDGFALFYPYGFDQAQHSGERNVQASFPDMAATSGFGLGIINAIAEANDIQIDLHALSDHDSLMKISIPVSVAD